MNDLTKAIFTTHIDSRGKLQDGKEMYDCPHCNGQCYIKEESISPIGAVWTLTYECTDCNNEWTEKH